MLQQLAQTRLPIMLRRQGDVMANHNDKIGKTGGQPLILRRTVLGGIAAATALMASRTLAAGDVLGQVVSVEGSLVRDAAGTSQLLRDGDALAENDAVATKKDSFAKLKLGADTHIFLGPETQLWIDHYLADQGGELELVSGQMVFDRPEGLPRIDVTVRTSFGMIGVRGTKFFAGPNRGTFSVYVEHGKVEVANGGVSRRVLGGEGVQIAPPDGAVRSLGSQPDIKAMARLAIPSVPAAWDQTRVNEAFASVGLK
jgi:hypothetical protein